MSRLRAAVAAALVLLLAGLAGTAPAPVAAQSGLATEKLVLVTASGRHEFVVEVADTPQTRAMGLMFRRTLGARRGMLFLYDKAQPIQMWMKNTYISLDMVFITGQGVVHRIARDTEPFSEAVIESGGDVVAVLEVEAGTAARIRLKPGDRVLHARFGTGP